jgi:hypothetical protein
VLAARSSVAWTGSGVEAFSHRTVIPTANPTISVFTIRTESRLLQSFLLGSGLDFNFLVQLSFGTAVL